jgi:RNA polymerase-binding transcription factor DksA
MSAPRSDAVDRTDENPAAGDADAVDLDAVDLDAVDLDAVERDLAAVEVALERLSEGTYWTDEVTGEPIAEQVLAADPTARRA